MQLLHSLAINKIEKRCKINKCPNPIFQARKLINGFRREYRTIYRVLF